MRIAILATLLALLSFSTAHAQYNKAMIAGHTGFITPNCINCGVYTGYGGSVGYALGRHFTASVQADVYTEIAAFDASQVTIGTFGLSAELYPKEAFKGFFIGPDITYIMGNQYYNGLPVFASSDLTYGGKVGWAITVLRVVKFVPHVGYGTWYDGSWGRITMGMKLGLGLGRGRGGWSESWTEFP